MRKSIFDENFEMEKYIEKRMLEVSKLEERQILKEVLSSVFIELYRQVEGEYINLENKLFNEIDIDIKHFEILTGIIEKKNYDVTDEIFKPMRANDLEENAIDTRLLLASMRKNTPFFIYTIFLKADYLKVKELIESNRKFRGIIKTEYGEYKGYFEVKVNRDYIQMIEKLYHIFNLNYLPWTTICTPYIHKLFDVFLYKIDEFDETEEILEVNIDFEEYSKFVKYSYLPLWNITEVLQKTSAYPEACIDKKNFEHVIFKHKLKEEATYLITNTEIPLTNIRRINGDLVMTCKEEQPVKWVLYQINKKANVVMEYPLMTNTIENNFSTYLADKYKTHLKTRTEVARLIAALGYETYLNFQDIEITDEDKSIETYNMDLFIEEEIRLVNHHRCYLILKFKAADLDQYLNRDIMSYIVTHIQKLFPEYHCIGRLV